MVLGIPWPNPTIHTQASHSTNRRAQHRQFVDQERPTGLVASFDSVRTLGRIGVARSMGRRSEDQFANILPGERLAVHEHSRYPFD